MVVSGKINKSDKSEAHILSGMSLLFRVFREKARIGKSCNNAYIDKTK